MAISLGYIENIKGLVQVKHSDGVVENMYDRAELFRGDVLITQKTSTAILKMNNGKSIPLDVDSRTTVNSNYSVKVRANTHHNPSLNNSQHEENHYSASRHKRSHRHRVEDDNDNLKTASGFFTPTSTVELLAQNSVENRTSEIEANILETQDSETTKVDFQTGVNDLDQNVLMSNAVYGDGLFRSQKIDIAQNNDINSGSALADILTGSAQSDYIVGNAGDDTISGKEGDDTLEGGTGSDTIDGGSGDDNLNGDEGDDTIIGGLGDDSISAGHGSDYIDSGEGNDIIDAGAGDDTIYGGSEIDYIFGQDGDDVIFSQEGDDTIYAGRGDDIVTGGLGYDDISGDLGRDTLYGNEGDDTLSGGADSDKLYGGDGADSINTGSGDDYVNAGLGDDVIDAREGNNIIDGAEGTDTVIMSGTLSDYGVTFKNDDEGKHILLIDNSGNTTELINVETIEFHDADVIQSVQTSTLQNDTLYISDTAQEDEDFDFTGSFIEGYLLQSGLIAEGDSIVGFGEIGQALVDGTLVYDVGHGNITKTADDTYTFRSDENYNGNLAFSIFIQDADGTITAIKAVAEVIAVDDFTNTISDSATVNEDSVITGNVLDNDSDADENDVDGLVLEVASFNVNNIDHVAGSEVIIAGIGTISIKTNGDFTFTAMDNYNGLVPEIGYTTNTGASDHLSIEVTPTDDATLTQSDTARLDEDSFVEGNVLSNDSDIDSDLSIVSFQLEGDLNVYNVGQRVGSDEVGYFTLNSDGSYIFTAGADYDGALPVVTYETNTGAKDTLSMTINPIDDETITFIDTASTQANTPLSVAAADGLLSNDIDIDSALSITTYSIDGVQGTFNAGQSTTVNAKGTITINADGSYSFTPSSDYTGIFPQVSYVTNTDASDTLSITISELDPAIAGVVTVESITNDDIINIEESHQTNINISGSATGGDISSGDEVVLVVNGTQYFATVQSNGLWSVNISGKDLSLDNEFSVDVHSSNAVGSEVTSSVISTHTLDLQATTAPVIELLNDSGTNNSDLITNDGTLNVTKSEESSILEYSNDGGTTWNSYAPTAVPGSNTILVHEIDASGNISAPGSITFTLVSEAVAGDVFVNNITLDDSLSLAESEGTVRISGRASGGDISSGDLVSMTINGTEYTTILDTEGNYFVEVAGSELASDTSFDVVVDSSNGYGNTVSSTTTSTHTLEVPIETNLILMIDLSTKMGDSAGTMSRLELAKASVNNLIDAYDAQGNLNVRIYTFSDSASATSWSGDITTVKDYVSGLNVDPGTKVFLSTKDSDSDYDTVVQSVIDDRNDSDAQNNIYLNNGAQNKIYFFSDGDATGSDSSGLFSTNSNTLDSGERSDWETFISDTGSSIDAIAVGEGTNTSDLSAIGPITTITTPFDLSDNVIAYNGSGVDAGSGLDTLVLDGGTQIDFDLVSDIKNIEVIDLKSENNQLHNISADDILSMTDSNNHLDITGVGHIDFNNSAEWTSQSDAIGNTTYTNINDTSITLSVENIIHIDVN